MPKNQADYELARKQSFGPVLGDMVVGLATSPVGSPLLTAATSMVSFSLIYQALYKTMPSDSLLRILGLGMCLVDIGYRNKNGSGVIEDAAQKGLSWSRSIWSFMTTPSPEKESVLARSGFLFR